MNGLSCDFVIEVQQLFKFGYCNCQSPLPWEEKANPSLSQQPAQPRRKSKQCVCKTWLHLLMDPSFAQLYQTRAHPCTILQPTYKHRNQHFYAVHFDNRNHVREIYQYRYHDFVKLGQLYVCNPITAEFIIVKPGIKLPSSSVCPCLGFCPKTQEYKVVLLSKQQYGVEVSNSMQTLVYTLGVKGNGLWKSVNVGNDVLGLPRNTTFLNGIIHWVVRSISAPQFIYSFDVEDECFKPVPPPPEFVSLSPEQTAWSKQRICLGMLDGCLTIGI
ncbi:hypothetical protein CMV_004261 [Castanea mollissima]|uniref:F-box associated beta-propeller type 3 domain-containing protein n=1 Tax=Castanea mollissima TaxID=60419 RepID=A0A8J4VVG3_9ROSI|nr:hypothetical protein CMV_004261 [Castanea mollissima]